jgi:hypothetical protein
MKKTTTTKGLPAPLSRRRALWDFDPAKHPHDRLRRFAGRIVSIFYRRICVGILSGLLLIIYILIQIKTVRLPGDSDSAPTLHETLVGSGGHLGLLMHDHLFSAGIYGGYFTPTEAAAIACFMGLSWDALSIRRFDIRKFRKSFWLPRIKHRHRYADSDDLHAVRMADDKMQIRR